MTLFFDGWYTHKQDAANLLEFVEEQGAVPIGIVERRNDVAPFAGPFGVLYRSDHVIFDNHIITEHWPNPLPE